MAVRSRTGVLGKGTPRVPPPGFVEPEASPQYFAWQQHPVNFAAPTTRGALNTLSGAVYVAPVRVRFNSIVVRITASTLPYTARVALYQTEGGGVSDALPLVAVATFSDLAPGRHVLPLDGGAFGELVPGLFWGVYGTNAGQANNVNFSAYEIRDFPLANGAATANGDYPTVFRTTTSASPIPATLDPFVGGADGAFGSALNWGIAFRLITV